MFNFINTNRRKFYLSCVFAATAIIILLAGSFCVISPEIKRNDRDSVARITNANQESLNTNNDKK